MNMPVYGHVLEVLMVVGLAIFVAACGVVIWRLLRCVHQWELVDKTAFGFREYIKGGSHAGGVLAF